METKAGHQDKVYLFGTVPLIAGRLESMEIRYQLLYMNMYHSVEVNDVDIIYRSLVYIFPSKQHCSPVIYSSEGEGRTWRRSLSSGSRTAPHTCSGDKSNTER